MSMPYTIKTIFDQMNISYMRVGGSKLGFNLYNPKYDAVELQEASCYPEKDSSISDSGRVQMAVGLYFRVNTTRKIYMFVAYEPDDTYTVYLWQENPTKKFLKTGQFGTVLDKRHGVYCDELGATIEAMYDQYINEHQQGFIRW